MDALTALQQRVSSPRLMEPAPSGEVLENIQNAAFRAADHGRMRPWRFLVLEGEGLTELGNLFVKSAEHKGEELTEKGRERLRGKPLRAPMIIVVIASCKENRKVPDVEQVISAGAAAQNMITAAYAQGVGSIWRTGDVAYDQIIKEGLGLSATESIVGFLYLGTVKGKLPEAPQLPIDEYFHSWP